MQLRIIIITAIIQLIFVLYQFTLGVNMAHLALKPRFEFLLEIGIGVSLCAMSMSALAQTAVPIQLDKVVVSAGQREQEAVDALDNVGNLNSAEIERINTADPARLLDQIPGVHGSATGDDPGTVANVRGLQEYGRVVVTIDGVRQDFGRPSHAGNGSFYLEPEMLKAVTVVRGPVAGVYGSGGIGGSISFETIDAQDFLRKDEQWAFGVKGGYETSGKGWLGRSIAAVRVNEKADFLISTVNRNRQDYKDGSGQSVAYSAQRVDSQMIKGSFRPAEGHELKVGWLRYGSRYDSSRSAGSTSKTLSVDDTKTKTDTANARYRFKSPDNPWLHIQAEVYRSVTDSDQTRHTDNENRKYRVRTNGWSLKNQSELFTDQWEHIISYGTDGYHLDGRSSHENFGEGTTKSWGAYGQWEAQYADWLQLIGALRYDHFKLTGENRDLSNQSISKSRVSPRLTLGIKPTNSLTTYVTYAEGFRAPSIAEVFRGGGHGSNTSNLPNFDLLPETASTIELGLNHRLDNVFAEQDAVRTKFSIYHTRVKDYIDRDYLFIQGRKYSQFRNVGRVTLRGAELESSYDAGRYYGRLTGSLVSTQTYNDRPLNNAPLKMVGVNIGGRSADRKWDYGVRWTLTAATERSSDTAPKAPGYQIVDLYTSWQPTKDATIAFGIDNVLNKTYTDPQAGYVADNPSSWQGRGRNIKLNLSWRYGK